MADPRMQAVISYRFAFEQGDMPPFCSTVADTLEKAVALIRSGELSDDPHGHHLIGNVMVSWEADIRRIT